jgi:hypothetical protein
MIPGLLPVRAMAGQRGGIIPSAVMAPGTA